MKFLLSLGLASMLATPVFAHDYTFGDLTIDHPMAFETAPGARTGAGYFSISNAGAAPARLVAVQADFPAVQIHLSSEVNGVMQMDQQEFVEIAPGATVTFAPGGLHVMFMGLNAEGLGVGAEFPATLVFEGEPPLEIVFHVESRDGNGEAMDHDAMDHDAMDHGTMDQNDTEADQ